MKLLTAFGHPVHQSLTDIPVGLWIACFVWQWVAQVAGAEFWWAVAFWTLLAGLVAALPVAATGLYDFLRIPREHPAKAVAIYHLVTNGAATVCFAGSLLAQSGPNAPEPQNLFATLASSTLGVVLLGVGSWYGGELVLRYGIGRLVPEPYLGPERRARPREMVHPG
ncbi:MAG: DUF2231 domain-containing protein [Elusimicrobia bacterium]|nr:DUF2231 domain-containing protein [Elusimicrobiota bacterium]